MVCAVVRSSKVEAIARALKKSGVSGCTVYPVRGYGEEWHLYEPLIHGGHYKLEAIVDEDRVENVVKEITEAACTGIEGDGVLTVFDLGKVVHIRTTKSVPHRDENLTREKLFALIGERSQVLKVLLGKLLGSQLQTGD